jgi:hypothetical protein
MELLGPTESVCPKLIEVPVKKINKSLFMNNQIGYSNVIQFMKYNVISYTKPWGYISVLHKYHQKETDFKSNRGAGLFSFS